MSVPKFEALTDDDIATGGERFNEPPDSDELIYQYKLLREHYIAETTALASKERALLLTMASRIAGVLVGIAAYRNWTGTKPLLKRVAEDAVATARALVAEVDK